MAGDWIKMRIDIATDPAVVLISSRTGLSEDEVVGKLHRLWGWADRHTTDGRATAITPLWVDRLLGCAGFALAMSDARWVSFDDSGVQFPRFNRHNGLSAKARAENTRRQKVSRVSRDKSATREEKKRKEKSKETTNVVSCGEPADGDELVMVFPCCGDGPQAWGLAASKVSEWSESYPGVDVLGECRKALQWCRDNPQRIKTHRGTPAFLSRWLSKAQDQAKGGFNGGHRTGNSFAGSDATRVRSERTDGDFANIPKVQGVAGQPPGAA